MISKNSKFTRMSMNDKNYIHLIGPEDEQTDWKLYQKKIGLVIYAAINIKSDIIFIIGKLSQYIINPIRHHEQAIKYLI